MRKELDEILRSNSMEAGKAMNEDGFACLGVWAILLDGAGG
jgi:hypothetical protein